MQKDLMLPRKQRINIHDKVGNLGKITKCHIHCLVRVGFNKNHDNDGSSSKDTFETLKLTKQSKNKCLITLM